MSKQSADLKPGRALDALVAEKVMGWRRCDLHQTTPAFHFKDQPPCLSGDQHKDHPCKIYPVSLSEESIGRYSTDISAAWEVVEKLCSYSERYFIVEKTGAWLVRFREGTFTPGETAPHAICLAALKAVGAR